MRVIKPSRIVDYCSVHPQAAGSLKRWLKITREGRWQRFADVKQTFAHAADEFKVASGRLVVCFNIKGNGFRLITAIHYDMGKVFVLRFMTHAEYSKNRWKEEL